MNSQKKIIIVDEAQSLSPEMKAYLARTITKDRPVAQIKPAQTTNKTEGDQ